MDLSNFNLGELKGLHYNIEMEIKDRQRQNVKKAREQILAIAQLAGVSVEELFATTEKKGTKEEKQKVKPQYQNPADISQTWAGRGRQPKWIAEALASGSTLDDFRI